ncbi:MAG TPA: ABC transporter permease [Vicinamibacterales bacterium]|nr:ABC transporter permease [Vicinamibacterales bacterium]
MALTPFVALVRKDLQIFASDRRAVIMAFVMPMAIGSFFGMLFSGQPSSDDVARIPVLLVDQDSSTISRSIVAGISTDKNLSAEAVPIDQARDRVRRGNATVAVVIPPGFGEAAGRAFFRGTDKPLLDFLYDPSHGMELAMVRGLMTQHVMEAVSREMFNGEQGRRTIDDALKEAGSIEMPEDRKKLLLQMLTAVQSFNRAVPQGSAAAPGSGGRAGSGISMPYEVHEEAVMARQNAGYNGFAHSFAGMGLQFMLFAAINLGIELLLERQLGLWKRLRGAPISKATLLGAKIASSTAISAMVLLVSFAFAMLVWHVRIEGSLAGFVGVALAASLMAGSYGLLVASLGKTPKTARGASTFATLLMVMLGGAWAPTFIFPRWLQRVTVIVPTRWAVDGLDAMTWRGLGFAAAVLPILMLLGFSALFAAIAVSRFRWEEE